LTNNNAFRMIKMAIDANKHREKLVVKKKPLITRY
jgi:hypothetical protein